MNYDIFSIPKLFYFLNGNDYTGSKDSVSYKIENGEKLRCLMWHGRLCSAKAEIEHEQSFDKSPGGYDALVVWMNETYNSMKEKL